MSKPKKSGALYEKGGSHKLLDEGGRLTLEVLVGTAALYVVRMALDEAETAAWEKGSGAAVDALAGEIVKDEGKFRKAGRTVPL